MKSPDCVEDEMMLQSRWSWPKVSTLGLAATGLTDYNFCIKWESWGVEVVCGVGGGGE